MMNLYHKSIPERMQLLGTEKRMTRLHTPAAFAQRPAFDLHQRKNGKLWSQVNHLVISFPLFCGVSS
jgi:hypothetical protein